MTEQELLGFCVPVWEDCRYDFYAPFVQDGFCYATDGRIIIRREDKRPNTEGRRLPTKLTELFEHDIRSKWKDWPKVNVSMVCKFCSRPDPPFEAKDARVAKSQSVGKQRIDVKYDKLIRELRNVKYRSKGGGEDAIYFRFDGGEGVLMPIASYPS